MFRKPFHLGALVVLLFIFSSFGAGYFFLLAAALLPLLYETFNNALKSIHSESLLKLPSVLAKIVLKTVKRRDPSLLEDKDIYRLKKVFSGLFYMAFLLLQSYCFFKSAAIIQNRIAFNLGASSTFVLYLVFHIFFLTIIRYEKRLQEQGAGFALSRESGRLNFLNLNLFLNLALVFLAQIIFGIGEAAAGNLYLQQIHKFLIFSVTTLIILFNAEVFLRNIWYLLELLRGKADLKADTYLVFLEIFFCRNTLKASIENYFHEMLGIDLKKSELCNFFFSIVEPVFIFSLILVWLLTSIVIIGPDQTGLLYRFGKITSAEGNQPGIAFKPPWPMGRYLLEKSKEVRLVNIGFEPDTKANYILWTKTHALENFNLLVGDGLEIISIDCQIMFRLKSARDFHLNYQNPEELLKVLAYRFLTLATVSSTFDSIMARNRSLFAQKLKTDLQKELDQRQAGIEILDVVFLAMHPPLEVAYDFEDVISAQLEKKTLELRASTESIHNRFMHRAFAAGEVFSAQGNAFSAVAEASGKAQAFLSQALGFNFSPQTARFRLKLDSLQKLIANKKLYVIDKSILRNNDKILLRVTE